MPVYEYECAACQHVFEDWTPSIQPATAPACPACGSTVTSRRLSVFSARSGQPGPTKEPQAGGCTRCGDPHGPCAL